jgi:hypothetical protein
MARVGLGLRELLDADGLPVLYVSGRHYNFADTGRITFPDQRWLKFPVEESGTRREDAIMTAVDQAGNKIARYRLARRPWWGHVADEFTERYAVEITVHLGQSLTDELMLALAISAKWLPQYFITPPPH